MTQVPVGVTLQPGTDPNNGGFMWKMGINPAAPQGPPYPAIHVDQGNSATITFSIQNGPGENFTFADKPMLVPPKAKGLDEPTVNGISMTVTDHNVQKGQIPYVLVFKGGAPKLDPIIDNDGGGSLQYFFKNPSVSGGGFFVLAILAAVGLVLLLRMLSKRP